MIDYSQISSNLQDLIFEEHCVSCDSLVYLTPDKTLRDTCPNCGAYQLVCSACPYDPDDNPCANCPYGAIPKFIPADQKE